jgi:predicted anti-sigma-YlaC factor YlaD
MPHKNEDALLSLFYGEVSQTEEQHLRQHLASCEDCREFMKLLQRMNKALNRWPEERPLPDTCDRILAAIPPEQPRRRLVRTTISPLPIFNIAFAMLFMLLLIYFAQSRISLLPIWHSLAQYWIFQALGSFGFVALIFFGIGSFITLSLAPILYFDLNKKTLYS